MLAVYQAALSAEGGTLVSYIHADERGTGLLEANKEGLLSLPGYWALQLLSLAGGHALYAVAAAAPASGGTGSRGRGRSPGVTTRQQERRQQQAVRRRRYMPSAWRAPVALGVAAVLCWALFAIAVVLQPVSRRACNAAYVLWMLALNAQCLALFAAADALAPGPPPLLLAALAQQMLPGFLLANVLTGGVNMSMDTLRTGDWTARGIVGAYAALLMAGVVLLDAMLGGDRV